MAPSIEPASAYYGGSGAAPTAAAGQWRASACDPVPVPAAPREMATGAAGSQASKGMGPRVPSLVFEIELEAERSEGRQGGEDEQVGVKELKRWLLPGSTGEFKLRSDVELGLAQYHQQLQRAHEQQQQQDGTAVEANQRLAAFLTRLGYKVAVRTALGGGEGYECLRNLRHVFLAVLPPGAHATTNRFVVDLSFKEQFCIAKPTPRYQRLLEVLPHTYVAPEASVAPLVNFMCHEMAQAFSATGVVLPPWRQTMSMLSKWLPRKSLEEQVPRGSHGAGALQALPAGGAAAGRRSTDVAAGQVHGHWAHATGAANTGLQQAQQQQQGLEGQRLAAGGAFAAAAALQQQPAILPPGGEGLHAAMFGAAAGLTRRQSSGPVVKPMSCEPQRVVVGGNFSTVGFA